MSSLTNGLFATSLSSMKAEAQFMKPHKNIPQENLTPTSRNKII
jgi:hypothetical protein